MKKYDVFIAHAYEDKDFAGPLAEFLRNSGLEVWYDSFVLSIGDSLRGKIDEGLSQSRFGVIVLSKSFFQKSWTNKELGGLAQLQSVKGDPLMLPVWHGISKQELLDFSPMLADAYAADSKDSIDSIGKQILMVIDKRGRRIDYGLPGYLARFVDLIEGSQGPEHIEAFIKLVSYSSEKLSTPMKDQFYQQMQEYYKASKVAIDYILMLPDNVTVPEIDLYIDELKPFAAQISWMHYSDPRITDELSQTNIVLFHLNKIAFTHDRDENSMFLGATEWRDSGMYSSLSDKVRSIKLVSETIYTAPRRRDILEVHLASK